MPRTSRVSDLPYLRLASISCVLAVAHDILIPGYEKHFPGDTEQQAASHIKFSLTTRTSWSKLPSENTPTCRLPAI